MVGIYSQSKRSIVKWNYIIFTSVPVLHSSGYTTDSETKVSWTLIVKKYHGYTLQVCSADPRDMASLAWWCEIRHPAFDECCEHGPWSVADGKVKGFHQSTWVSKYRHFIRHYNTVVKAGVFNRQPVGQIQPADHFVWRYDNFKIYRNP